MRNLCWAKANEFTRWDGSETRKLVQEAKGIEIELPNLETSVFDTLEDENTAFSKATEENGFPFRDFLMVNAFLSLARPELEKGAEYLGLNLSPVAMAGEESTDKVFQEPKGAAISS